MISRPENIFNYTLSRRDLLKFTAASVASAAASTFEPLTATQALAQTEAPAASPQDPTRLLPLKWTESVVAGVEIGRTTDREILTLPYRRRELLQGGLTKFSFVSSTWFGPVVPPMVITGADGKAQFKRIFITEAMDPTAYVDTPQFTSIYGPPEATEKSPDSNFWNSQAAPPAETLIFARQGFALVALPGREDPDHVVFEIQVFNPTSVERYLQTWAKVDRFQSQAVLDDPAPSALITLDGLGSELEMDAAGLGTIFLPLRQSLYSSYDFSARFSYTGSFINKYPNLPPMWKPNGYHAGSTYQDIYKSVEALRELIDGIRSYYTNIDLMGYSLGGVVAFKYLERFVMSDLPSHDSPIRSALLLDAPVNGVSGAELSYYLRGLGLDTQLGNDATTYLAALASSPQRQQDTTGLNIKTAEILRDRRNIKLLCLANGDDCFVKPKSAIIPGFGYALPLGRGANGIPNCDTLLLAPILRGDDSTNVGHTQILTDSRALSTIADFLGGHS